jgi:periplasmic protein CpxP/Spy
MNRIFHKIALASTLAAGMAFAQTPAPQPAPATPAVRPRGMVRRRLFKALDLTDAQRQQARTIFQQARQNAQPIQQQLKQNRQAFAAAVKANDTAQIQALATQQGALHGQALAIRGESMAKFYGTLTPEQRAKADQVQQRMRQRMQQRKLGNKG